MTPKLHRVDIDFLRAISVIAVIIYHADFKYGNFHFLKGGFLGVDIFFVISGFLITKILIEENIFRVYPDRVFCDNYVSRRCIAHDDKSIFYDDTYHLSLDGVKLVSYELLNKLNELF